MPAADTHGSHLGQWDTRQWVRSHGFPVRRNRCVLTGPVQLVRLISASLSVGADGHGLEFRIRRSAVHRATESLVGIVCGRKPTFAAQRANIGHACSRDGASLAVLPVRHPPLAVLEPALGTELRRIEVVSIATLPEGLVVTLTRFIPQAGDPASGAVGGEFAKAQVSIAGQLVPVGFPTRRQRRSSALGIDPCHESLHVLPLERVRQKYGKVCHERPQPASYQNAYF